MGTVDNGLFHFLSVQGDGRKIPGLVKSINFQRSTEKSPKIPGSWQHFATKFIEIEIFTLTDFSRARKEKNIFQGLDWRVVLQLNIKAFKDVSCPSAYFFRLVFRGENMPGKFFQALLFRRQKIPPHLLEKPYIHRHLLRTKLAKMLGNSE